MISTDAHADAGTDTGAPYWESAAYLAVADAQYDARRGALMVHFADGDCVDVPAWRLIGRGERHPDWAVLGVVDGMHVSIPTPNGPIELPGFTIRAVADPIFAAHLAREAEARARRIGGRLKALRAARGLTTQQLGERVGMAQQNISRIEQGRHAVSYATLEKLLAAMGYTLADLSGERGESVGGL